MDFLEFLAHSEWPLLIGGAVWLARAPLVDMLKRINVTQVDAWGFKAAFERTLDNAEALVPPKPGEDLSETAPVSQPQSMDAPTRSARNYARYRDPEVEILASWQRLEDTIRQLSRAKHQTYRHLEVAAREEGLTDDDVAALVELRSLRSQVAHATGTPVTDLDAARFKRVAQRLLARVSEGSKKGETDELHTDGGGPGPG